MSAENNQIDEMITTALADRVPADVQDQLHQQLAAFRTKVSVQVSPRPARFLFLGRRTWWGTLAAAVLMIIAVGWLMQTRVSFAEVASAVLQQPWIHVSSIDPDGRTHDVWYSPTKDISATRADGNIEYRDHRLRIYHSYNADDKNLYRVPEYVPRRANDAAMLTSALRILLQAETPVERPMEQLGFLRDESTNVSKVNVVEQRLERVMEEGKNWLDYHLSVHLDEHPAPFEMVFRVEPETKLLRVHRVVGTQDGKQLVRVSRFEYPEKGPADAYELGVPQTAKVIDRTPTADVARILETMKAGRQRMDNYKAYVVRDRTEAGTPYGWEISYRKGDKFRRDFTFWKPEITRANWPKPTDGEDLTAWFGRQMDKLSIRPVCIVHGSSHYYDIQSKEVTNADGSRTDLEVKKYPGINIGAGDLWPVHYYLLPEFVCRPTFGIPSESMDPVLEMELKDGPPGTVLLRVRRGRMHGAPNANPDGVQTPDNYHYWLDPARDYIAVRWDMLGDGEPGKQEVLTSTIIEETARSPQGIWYATRFRQKSSTRGPNKEPVADSVYSFYLDFTAELPDSLFDPPK